MSKKRKAAIIGLGNFGKTIVEQLIKNGLEVMAIDKNKSIVDECSNEYSEFSDLLSVVHMNATDSADLEEIMINNFDIVIVAIGEHGDSDPFIIVHNLNKLGVKSIIARGRHKDDSDALEKMGAHRTVVPEIEAAFRVSETVITSRSDDIVEREQIGEEVKVDVRIDKDSYWLEQTIQSLKDGFLKENIKVEIESIKKQPINEENGKNANKDGKKPNLDYVMQLNDVLVIMGKEAEMKKFDEFLDKTQKNYETEQKKEKEKEKEKKKNKKNGKK